MCKLSAMDSKLEVLLAGFKVSSLAVPGSRRLWDAKPKWEARSGSSREEASEAPEVPSSSGVSFLVTRTGAESPAFPSAPSRPSPLAAAQPQWGQAKAPNEEFGRDALNIHWREPEVSGAPGSRSSTRSRGRSSTLIQARTYVDPLRPDVSDGDWRDQEAPVASRAPAWTRRSAGRSSTCIQVPSFAGVRDAFDDDLRGTEADWAGRRWDRAAIRSSLRTSAHSQSSVPLDDRLAGMLDLGAGEDGKAMAAPLPVRRLQGSRTEVFDAVNRRQSRIRSARLATLRQTAAAVQAVEPQQKDEHFAPATSSNCASAKASGPNSTISNVAAARRAAVARAAAAAAAAVGQAESPAKSDKTTNADETTNPSLAPATSVAASLGTAHFLLPRNWFSAQRKGPSSQACAEDTADASCPAPLTCAAISCSQPPEAPQALQPPLEPGLDRDCGGVGENDDDACKSTKSQDSGLDMMSDNEAKPDELARSGISEVPESSLPQAQRRPRRFSGADIASYAASVAADTYHSLRGQEIRLTRSNSTTAGSKSFSRVVDHSTDAPSWRSRAWTFLEATDNSNPALRYGRGMTCMILLSVLLTLLQACQVELMDPRSSAIVVMVTDCCFVTEVLVRMLVCPSLLRFLQNVYNIIDIASGVLSLVSRAMVGFEKGELDSAGVFVLLCVVPVLRLCKTLRRFQTFHLLLDVVGTAVEALPVLMFVFLLILLVFSSLLYIVEPRSNIESLPIAMWLTIITMTTTGYGDVAPVSDAGRAIVAILVVICLLYMSMPLGILGSEFTKTWQNRHRVVVLRRTRERFDQWGFEAADLPKLFRHFDVDGNGELCLSEFKTLLGKARIGLTDDFILKLFEALDVDATGSIDERDMVRALYPSEFYQVYGSEVRNGNRAISPPNNHPVGSEDSDTSRPSTCVL